MIPYPSPTTTKARKLISSIYEICVFGNGTVDERDQFLAEIKVKPCYMKAKWFHFNHFGLNQIKVENAAIMFFAKTTCIAVDVLSLPVLISTGIEDARVVKIIYDTSQLVFFSVSKLVLQEILEHKFNSKMFQFENPQFHNETKQFEESIIKKHEFNFDILNGYVDLLKKLGAVPMLNYIFFHYQMTEEYLIYRKNYSNKKNIYFKHQKDAKNYFKTLFRMLRFHHYTEVHALNYFFSQTFHKIINFYNDPHLIQKKYRSVFYPNLSSEICSDIKDFMNLLNFQIQRSEKVSVINQEIREDAFDEFQHFYSHFFFSSERIDQQAREVLCLPEIKSNIELNYDDDIKNKIFLILAKEEAIGQLQEYIQAKALDPLGRYTKDGLSYVLKILTNINSPQKHHQIRGTGVVIGIAALVGGIVAATVIGIKYRAKVSKFANALYSKVISPAFTRVQKFEEKIHEVFQSNNTAIHSTVHRVLGSILFVVSHIPGLQPAASAFQYLTKIICFNPVTSFILRNAEKFTAARLEQKDLDILHRVDQWIRLGYNKAGTLCVKMLNRANEWLEEFDIDLINDEFLKFLTFDFARVVRHQIQIIGVLFEEIALLDNEIHVFQQEYSDILYTERVDNKPEYYYPMCKVSNSYANPTQLRKNSKKRFFDILIERQNLMMCLINRTYYVTIYNLTVEKIRAKCQNIFDKDLSEAIAHLDNQILAGIV